MKYIFLSISFFISFFAIAQANFENGYFIDRNNNKVSCLIKNSEWHYSPKFIEYKLDEGSFTKTISVDQILEFKTINSDKYINIEIQIDKSENSIDNLNTSPAPVFVTEKILLRELLSGNVNLFSYTTPNFSKYFIQKDNSAINQLIYKMYGSHQKVMYNKFYINQLQNVLACKLIDRKKLNSLKYTLSDLKEVILKNNVCDDEDFKIQKKNINDKNKITYHLNITPRLNIQNFTTQVNPNDNLRDFETSKNISLGLENEFVLPFKNRNISLLIEPNLNHYDAEYSGYEERVSKNVTITNKFSLIDLPVGVRYYFNFNEKSKLFLNTHFNFGIVLNAEDIVIKRYNFSDINVKQSFGTNILFGLGYKYQKFGIESRFSTKRSTLVNYIGRKAEYTNISLILSYTLL